MADKATLVTNRDITAEETTTADYSMWSTKRSPTRRRDDLDYWSTGRPGLYWR